MATTHDIWRDHAGARWLVPMIAVMALMILGLLGVLVYPHISG